MMSILSLRRSLLVTVAVLLLGAPAAGGATHRVWQAAVNEGPLVAGSHTVWTEYASPTAFNDPRNGFMPTLVQDLGPDGRVTTMHTTRDPSCDMVSLKAASSRLVVAAVIHADRLPTECARASANDAEILAAPPGRPLAALQIDPDHCPPQAMALDGSRMAILSAECPGRELAVFDLDSGARVGGVAIDYRLFQGSGSLALLALAGDHVALLTGLFAPKVVEFNWRTGTQELEVAAPLDIERLNTGDQLAAGPDGTVVAGFPNYSSSPFAPPKVIWASPAAPTAHLIDAGLRMFGPQLVDGLIPAAATGHRQFAADLDGRVRIDLGHYSEGVVFGAVSGFPLMSMDAATFQVGEGRYALMRNGTIHNGAWPPAPREIPDGLPPGVPTTSPRPPAGTVAIVRPSASGGLRTIRGSWVGLPAPSTIEVGIVRVGGSAKPGRASAGETRCRQVTASGRLRSVRPLAGHCAPTRFIDATGIATWRLRLARRLPSGRYSVFARGRARDGHRSAAAVIGVRLR
jgi:hypothetical protein